MPLAVAVNPGKVNKGELILRGWRAGWGVESGVCAAESPPNR